MTHALPLSIDAARLQHWLDTLAEFSEAPAPAVTRVLFSTKIRSTGDSNSTAS